MERNIARTEFETPRTVGDLVEFKTNFKVGDFVTKIARFESDELKRITRFAQNAEIPTLEEIKSYLITLLKLRVDLVTGGNISDYRKILRTARVPARWFILLSQIGEAKDYERKFKFTPALSLDKDFVPFTAAQIEDISWKLENLLQEGYSTVPGIPTLPDGSLPFMAKTTIGDYIRGIDKDNPAYAFLAAVLEAEVAAESYDNLDLVFRMQYSTLDTYSAAFQSYFVQSAETLGGNTANGETTTE